MGRGESPSTRIVWQGFVDPDAQRPYVERLVAYLGAVADEGTEFGFVGLSPPDVHLHRLTETAAPCRRSAASSASPPRGSTR
jgi:hypothetical protein